MPISCPSHDNARGGLMASSNAKPCQLGGVQLFGYVPVAKSNVPAFYPTFTNIDYTCYHLEHRNQRFPGSFLHPSDRPHSNAFDRPQQSPIHCDILLDEGNQDEKISNLFRYRCFRLLPAMTKGIEGTTSTSSNPPCSVNFDRIPAELLGTCSHQIESHISALQQHRFPGILAMRSFVRNGLLADI